MTQAEPTVTGLGDSTEAVRALGAYEFDDARAVVAPVDIEALDSQLGRPSRGVVGIAARCVCGRPLVVRTAPRLEDGTPFPTTYYLTHPALTSSVSTLEANGVMKELTALLEANEDVGEAYAAAHEQYLAQRKELGDVPEIEGISAGGMPTRVKCLHVLTGHALAAGPGVNPLGDEAIARVIAMGLWSPTRCWC